MEKNGYVRWWQLATASLTVLSIAITLLLFLTKEVIGVDERRQISFMDNRRAIVDLLNSNHLAHTQIMVDLQEIKTTLGIRSQK